MTHFLVTDDNPEGSQLEEVLRMVRADIVHRQVKIIDDTDEVAQEVIRNNIKILDLLSDCIGLATDSTRSLEKAFGRSGSSPRIGVE
ncbi:MAG: hypothetical protein V3R73_05335 [Sphingomonadales bacterium]